MKNLFLILLCVIAYFNANSQVTLSPEIGISYLPFTLYGANIKKQSNRMDYVFGISSQVQIHKKWLVISKISYVDREDIKWHDLCTCPEFFYDELRHYDINLDFSLMKTLGSKIKLGIGPSLILKVAEIEGGGIQNPYIYGGNKKLYGVNSIVRFQIKNVHLNLMYIRIFNGLSGYATPDGNNRLDLTLGYSLFSR